MKNWSLNLFFVLILLGVNVFFLYPIFQGELTRFPGSIESVFLAEAKFIVENFPHISWNPFWYFGFPFYLAYQPIPIFLTALVSLLPGVSLGLAYRILTGIFLILGVVGVYFWSKSLTGNKVAAFTGALAFLLLPSIAYLFLPSTWQGFGLLPIRLVNALVYGEGPHIWGLALVPFACLFFQRMVGDPKERVNWIGAIILISTILLTSLTAFVGLVVFLFFIFWTGGYPSHFKRKFLTSLLVGIFVIGLSFFWYNPQFVAAAFDYSLGEGGGVFSGPWASPVFSFFVLTTLFGFFYILYAFLSRRLDKNTFQIVLPASIFVFLFLVIYGWFAWGVAVFPLPFKTIPRLIPELELAFALFLAATISFLPQRQVSLLAAGTFIIIILLLGFSQKDKFWYILTSHKDFAQTSEFVVAQKLKEIGAERVYATGTHAFWLNVFADIPQLRGGKGGDFGGLNPWWAHLTHFINKGDNPQLTERWLRSLGIEYIIINYPGSLVYFHDFINLDRFNKFEEVFNFEGDKILKLPTRNVGLALALPRGWDQDIKGVEDLSAGIIVLDEERLGTYLSAAEGKARVLGAEFEGGNWSKIKIPGNQVVQGEDVLIRQTYYPGWSAKSAGRKIKVTPDPIGFIKIGNPGPDEIILSFAPPMEVKVSWILTGMATIVFILFVVKGWQQKLV